MCTHLTHVSQDLRDILDDLGPGNPEDYIIDPTNEGRYAVKRRLSKAFTHFWKLSGNEEKKTFMHLRKTYISKLYQMEGDKSLVFKHGQTDVAIRHYLDQKETISRINQQKMYENLDVFITPFHNTST